MEIFNQTLSSSLSKVITLHQTDVFQLQSLISAMNNSWKDNFLDVMNDLDELNQTLLLCLK